MNNIEKLSSVEYWDTVLENAKLPLKVNTKDYSTWLLNNFFSNIIQEENCKTLIEVGAGSSAWLPFLAERYKLVVSGLDYSEVGCRLCKENLKIQGVEFQEILNQDVLEWNDKKKYDILISFGVIEHFESPELIVKICERHINTNGIIITIIPNLSGLPGWIVRRYLPKVSDMHKNISLNELINLHEVNGFYTLKANYSGFVYPMLIPWSSKKNGLFGFKYTRKSCLYIIEILNFLVSKLLTLLRISGSYKNFSPFIVYVGKLPKQSNL